MDVREESESLISVLRAKVEGETLPRVENLEGSYIIQILTDMHLQVTTTDHRATRRHHLRHPPKVPRRCDREAQGPRSAL
jgi:hypothetical protein